MCVGEVIVTLAVELNGVRLDEQNRKGTHKWHT